MITGYQARTTAEPGSVESGSIEPGNVESGSIEPRSAAPMTAELSEAEVDRIFRALADATRRDIVRRTLSSEATISELAGDYDMSFAAVQKHVTALEAAGLVVKEARGRERVVRGAPERIERIQDLLRGFEEIWRGRIGRMDDLFAEDPPTTG
ncbi:hypothetical protein GCM10022377_22280 [Zhihengliuella alba]|uniref:HTH arsR-type domain-containing protein n=1 Tax=Zhihengliuella alba TaxID=547018 RepID=A0ABP7DR81_9MICC